MNMKIELTTDEMMNVVDAAVDAAREREYYIDEDELIKDMTYILDAALAAMGIEIVLDEEEVEEEEDMDDEDEDDYFSFEDEDEDFNFEDEDEDEDEEDTCQYTLTAKGDFILRYIENGHSFKEACEIADLLFGEDEGE